jgi:hypothetical protein
MENKPPRILQLGGKSRPHLHPTVPVRQNSRELVEVGQNLPVMSYHASRPILIRYIDPRLVPIFKELTSLTSQCQLIAQEATLPAPTPQHQRIEQLLQSTKKISDQFHSIIDDSQQISTEAFQTDPTPSTLESEGQK